MRRTETRWTLFSMLVVCGVLSACVLGRTAAQPSSTSQKTALSLPFIENRGQAHPSVAFMARCLDASLSITRKGELIYSLPERDRKSTHPHRFEIRESPLGSHHPSPKGRVPSPVNVNWFRGSDPSGWRMGLPAWERVDLGEIAPGIHAELACRDSNVEKIFTLAPRADADRILMRLDGVQELHVEVDGTLAVRTSRGCVHMSRPVAWQEDGSGRKPVEVRYRIRDRRTYGFTLGPHDPDRPVLIDPLLSSTFLGTAHGDSNGLFETAMAQDASGNVYLADHTDMTSFPSQTGGYDTTHNGSEDLFIARLNPSLTTLQAITFLGGSKAEGAYSAVSLAVTPSGEVLVAGKTSSSDFPTTAGAFCTTYQGSGDAFVAKLDGNLSALLASTFLGGTSADSANAVACDASGRILVSGWTRSTSFPVTAGTCGGAFHGGQDVFLSILDPNLTTLQSSTVLGGARDDFSEGMAIGASGSIYLTGWTSSRNIPTTASAYGSTYRGGFYDAFAMKVSGDLRSLQAATYLGGADWDFAYALALDPAERVYLTGHTASTDFPTTEGAWDRSFNSTLPRDQGDDAFVARLDSNLQSLEASTLLGGQEWEIGLSIALGSDGTVFVAGNTSSSSFPVTSGAFSTTYHGGSVKYTGDLFLAAFSADLSRLKASTFLGGSRNDGCDTLLLDSSGALLVSGATNSPDFPTIPGGVYPSYPGGDDPTVYSFFVSRMSADLSRFTTGDVNSDGGWNLLDVLVIREYLAGNLTPGTPPFCAPSGCADLNADGTVDERDCLVLESHLLE